MWDVRRVWAQRIVTKKSEHNSICRTAETRRSDTQLERCISAISVNEHWLLCYESIFGEGFLKPALQNRWVVSPTLCSTTCLYKNAWNSNPITGLDRPWRFQEIEAPKISRQSAHGGGKVVSPTHRPPLPPGNSHYTSRVGRVWLRTFRSKVSNSYRESKPGRPLHAQPLYRQDIPEGNAHADLVLLSKTQSRGG
jgi:hypothetical protein